MKKQKSYKISQWLQILKEPYRSQAIREWKKRDLRDWSDEYQEKLDFAIFRAFCWASTKKGYDYWHNLRCFISENPKKFVQPKYHHFVCRKNGN